MYQVLVWSDDKGDFVWHESEGRVWFASTEMDAAKVAAAYIATGRQAKVEYIRSRFRKEKRATKNHKSGRIQRIQTTMLDGEQVRIVGIIDLRRAE